MFALEFLGNLKVEKFRSNSNSKFFVSQVIRPVNEIKKYSSAEAYSGYCNHDNRRNMYWDLMVNFDVGYSIRNRSFFLSKKIFLVEIGNLYSKLAKLSEIFWLNFLLLKYFEIKNFFERPTLIKEIKYLKCKLEWR